MDDGDRGMVDGGQQAGLALESRQPIRTRSVLAENLDSNQPTQSKIAGAVDRSHAALSDGADHLIAAKPGSWVHLMSATNGAVRRLLPL
jgi:hypothetical protein